MFQNAIGAKYTMVPYRGAGQSMQDLVAGQLDVMLDTPAVSMPQIQWRQHQGLCRDRRSRASRSCRISRRPTRPDCRASTSRSGTPSGCRRARRRRSSPNSTGVGQGAGRSGDARAGSPRSRRRFSRRSSRRRRRLAPITKPKLTNGGRSSRKRGSSPNDRQTPCVSEAPDGFKARHVRSPFCWPDRVVSRVA